MAILAVNPPPARGDVQYTVTDLGNLGGGSSCAYGINNAGLIVGNGYIEATSNLGLHLQHAFLYSGGQIQDLGTPSNPQGMPTVYSYAYGINDAGLIVGCATDELGATSIGYLYSGGQMQQLTGWISAQAVNNAGQVVGCAWPASGNYTHAFLYSGGQMQDLGTLPGDVKSFAYGLNNAGQVVGQSESSRGALQAFLYSGGQMQALGTIAGGFSSIAYGINDSGQVVGDSDTDSGAWHAFLYSGGQVNDLGTLGGSESHGTGINSLGQVVGYSNYLTGSGNDHAFLYSNGAMIDLNTLIDPSSGWTIDQAYAINDEGQIVGDGVNSAGQWDAFLLTPTPEPATLSLLALGGLAILRRRPVGLFKRP
jgi:probable HAF family extracellular repeat protein